MTIKLLEDGNILVHIDCVFRNQSGRRRIVTSDDTMIEGQNPAIRAALARARRWAELLESGTYSSTKALAKALKLDDSYIARFIRLKYLAPMIVERIMEGREPCDLTISKLLTAVKEDIWTEQCSILGIRD